MRRSHRVRWHISSKPDTCTEGADVYATDIRVKECAHYPGRSGCLPETAMFAERRTDERPEVSRSHSNAESRPCEKGQILKKAIRPDSHEFREPQKRRNLRLPEQTRT